MPDQPPLAERIAAARARAQQAFQRLCRGMGPDAPTVAGAHGGRQSAHPWRLDLVDPGAWYVLGRVLDYGARKYSPDEWRLIPTREHVNAALLHLVAYLGGDRSDDHLGHALCRTHFALAVALADEVYDPHQADEPTAHPSGRLSAPPAPCECHHVPLGVPPAAPSDAA